jgi:hypothetical protein
MPWSSHLTSPIPLKDGRVLLTLRHAADLFLSFGEAIQRHDWNVYAAELLIEAAKDGSPRTIEAATRQVQRALFREGMV